MMQTKYMRIYLDVSHLIHILLGSCTEKYLNMIRIVAHYNDKQQVFYVYEEVESINFSHTNVVLTKTITLFENQAER